jgi:ATP-binding cassette subfamily C protein CydD
MDAIGASERILQILAEPLPVRRDGLASLPRVAHTIRFDEVFLSYDGKQEALAACSFEVPANSVTAIVGASGAGKSTVLNVLLGFARAQRGRILVSDVDLAEVNEDAWLAQLAWVPQRAHLFAGSVADNIRLGKPDASLDDIVACARAAQADAFIGALAQGYDTKLGERGAGLSGGQVQRIALARAFLKDAPVLVLDEPTAHLDAQSQRDVMDALAVLARGRTVLMLTHRLHTLALADHVVVLDAGRVVDAGPRERLAHAGGAFARMLQTGAEMA